MMLGAEVTWNQFFFNNLLPVTLGNTIAGVLMMVSRGLNTLLRTAAVRLPLSAPMRLPRQSLHGWINLLATGCQRVRDSLAEHVPAHPRSSGDRVLGVVRHARQEAGGGRPLHIHQLAPRQSTGREGGCAKRTQRASTVQQGVRHRLTSSQGGRVGELVSDCVRLCSAGGGFGAAADEGVAPSSFFSA
jgi:hypothetical protein